MEITKITYLLLTKGIYKGDASKHINEINRRLRPLFYEAVMLYDKSCCVLKNNSNRLIFSEYLEKDNLEIKTVIEKVVKNERVESYILESLIANNWVERVDDKLNLSIRSLVQFYDYVLDLQGRYTQCSLCKQLVDGRECHEYCEDLLNKER